MIGVRKFVAVVVLIVTRGPVTAVVAIGRSVVVVMVRLVILFVGL